MQKARIGFVKDDVLIRNAEHAEATRPLRRRECLDPHAVEPGRPLHARDDHPVRGPAEDQPDALEERATDGRFQIRPSLIRSVGERHVLRMLEIRPPADARVAVGAPAIVRY